MIMPAPRGVGERRACEERRSGCGKELSWTKPRAYVGKVSISEGLGGEYGGREQRAFEAERGWIG
jgi:hypothetical protein